MVLGFRVLLLVGDFRMPEVGPSVVCADPVAAWFQRVDGRVWTELGVARVTVSGIRVRVIIQRGFASVQDSSVLYFVVF